MANQRVTDLDPIVTLPNSGIIHVVDTTNNAQDAAGSSFKITKADLLKENTAAILLNTAKVGITPDQATAITNNTNKVGYTDALVASAPTVIANTAKVGITTTQASSITTNNAKIGYTDALVSAAPTVVANTAKVGISTVQANAITVNTSKVSYTDALVAAAPAVVANTSKVGYSDALVAAAPTVVANTAKVGITPTQASAITANTAKVGITTAQATAITDNTANTSKVSINNDAASLANVRSLRYREETYSSNLDMVMQSSVGVYAWVNVFTIAFNVVNSLVTRFKNRVATDGGVFSNQTALETFLGTITGSLTTVLAAITPNAVKASKLFSVIPNTSALDATVVRNTTATTINSSGIIVLAAINVPRISHTLNTGGEGFILDEPQATNLIPFSNDLTNVSWSKSSGGVGSVPGITLNAGTSPENTSNATRVVFNLNSGTSSADSSVVSFSSGSIANRAGSLFVKTFDGTTKTIYIRILNTGGLIAKTVTPNWTRISEIGSSDILQFGLRGTFGTSASADILIYNTQLETGTIVTSAIPTNGAAVTRNKDDITLAPPTGTVKITTTFSDNTTQVLTTIPATYTMPEGLIKSVNFNNTL